MLAKYSFLVLVLSSFLFTSCGNAPLRGNDVVGADEFVIDSYKIRQGKYGILELKGENVSLLTKELLEDVKLISKGKVYFIGMVEKPFLDLEHPLRLFEALSLAKISPQANLFRSYVVRNDQMLPIDLYKLIKEGDMSQNIPLYDQDKIYIADPASSNIMVMGEVRKQTVIPITDGTLTLQQALASAEGIPYTGDKSYIQVIRGSLQHPKIYTLNWKHVMRLPSDSLLLIPGDVVYVATTPLGEWNNFVTQILPTLIGADLILGHKRLSINAN